MIIFNALIDSDETLIIKALNFKILVETLFLNDFFTDFRSEKTLNDCL